MIGFTGKIIEVNLDLLTVSQKPSSEYPRCGAEFGMGYDILFQEPSAADQLDNGDKLVITGFPLANTRAFSVGDHKMISIRPDDFSRKSDLSYQPDTTYDEYWGSELRCSGCDAVIIHGIAVKPVYIFLCDEHAEIKDASSLWDLDIDETKNRIYRQLKHPKIKIITIGPANEYLAMDSLIPSHPCQHSDQMLFGRAMVSLNLKAIAVRGSRRWSQRFERYVKI